MFLIQIVFFTGTVFYLYMYKYHVRSWKNFFWSERALFELEKLFWAGKTFLSWKNFFRAEKNLFYVFLHKSLRKNRCFIFKKCKLEFELEYLSWKPYAGTWAETELSWKTQSSIFRYNLALSVTNDNPFELYVTCTA